LIETFEDAGDLAASRERNPDFCSNVSREI